MLSTEMCNLQEGVKPPPREQPGKILSDIIIPPFIDLVVVAACRLM